MMQEHRTEPVGTFVFCPLCEAETDVRVADVQSPTLPPFMPDRVVLVGILRSRGHVCRRQDMDALALADMVKWSEGRRSP